LGFDSFGLSFHLTPYSGLPIDSVTHESMSSTERDALWLSYESLVGSLNWIAHTTRPDLSTVVSLLDQHQSNPSPAHMEAACYAAKYLAHPENLGSYFTSCCSSIYLPFYIFRLALHLSFQCQMPIWYPKMLPNHSYQVNYLCLSPDLCQPFILVYMDQFIGYLYVKVLQLVVQLRLKFRQQMNALSSY